MKEDEWFECADPTLMLEALQCKPSDRKRMLFACASCDRIVHFADDARSRSALAALRRAADGRATLSEIKREINDATSARKSAMRFAFVAVMGVENFDRTSKQLHTGIHQDELIANADPATNAAWAVELAVGTAIDASQVVATAERAFNAVCCADSQKERGTNEKAIQAIFIRCIFGNPFHPIAINPSWLTPTVTDLATIAYEERILPSGELHTTRLSILADALEDVGCDHPEILGHLRSPGPHVRGCWALDLLLGRN